MQNYKMICPHLSIIVPCYNEKNNILPFIEKINAQTSLPPWEIIFVDDNSPDSTITMVRHAAQTDPRIRGLRRIGRRGLSSAVIEGALSSSAPLIAVMDGDLQHDESCLIPMIHALESGQYDLAVASRHIDGGTNQGLANPWRRFVSYAGRWCARHILKTSLTDPMSGFFALRRDCFDNRASQLSSRGFKILIDLILADTTPLRIIEFPLIFRKRLHGDSKLDGRVILSFINMIVRQKYLRHRK